MIGNSYPAEKISISGRRFPVPLFCSLGGNASIIEADNSELPPISMPAFELFDSDENDLTNLFEDTNLER